MRAGGGLPFKRVLNRPTLNILTLTEPEPPSRRNPDSPGKGCFFMAKIAIIGAGQVGATAAYTLAVSGLAQEIAVVDLNVNLARGVANDIAHGMPFCAPTRLSSGSYEAAEGADLIFMTAGASQRPGESRRNLAGRNLQVMESACSEIVRRAPAAVLVVVSNPLDALTRAAADITGFPARRVFGSGTVLDTMRLRAMLADHAGVDARNVHAYVLGEHGDSELPAWSLARIAGMSLAEYCGVQEPTQAFAGILNRRFEAEVRDAAYALIEQKGSTCYAVALAMKRIASAVLRDERAILTVSAPLNGEYGLRDVALSLPCVVGRAGIVRILTPTLSSGELDALKISAGAIQATLPERVPG